MEPTYDTIVVGLGAAGTAAASTLAKAGRKVLALEAQNRIGGRVNTVPFGDGLVELGAEWIHGTEASSIYELAIKNNVSLLPQDLSFKVYFSDGTSGREEIVNDLTNFALQVIDDPPKEPQPLGQYITKRIQEYIKTRHPSVANDTDFVSGFLEFLDLVIDNYESSNSWDDVTTETRYQELGGHQHMSWHKHGYGTLFQILLNTYNNGPGYPSLETRLGAEVTHIQWSQDPLASVQVTLKDGTVYSARNVIVTLSVGVLKERHSTLFSLELPPEKVTAINSISIGLLDKVQLYFAQPWWVEGESYDWCWDKAKKDTVSEEDKWTTKIIMASNPLGCRNALTVWFSGDTARLVFGLAWYTFWVDAGKTRKKPLQISFVAMLTAYKTLFTPALPEQKTQSIDRINIGVVNKIVLRFAYTWWQIDYNVFNFLWRSADRASLADDDKWLAKLLGATQPKPINDALTFWLSGDTAKMIETLPEDVVKRKVMGVIRRFMRTKMTIPEPVEMLRSTWYSNPFTRGSYTYDDVNTPLHPGVRGALAAPLTDSAGAPRVLFAGEATDDTHFSTVHGAVDSGRREALRLLPSSKI